LMQVRVYNLYRYIRTIQNFEQIAHHQFIPCPKIFPLPNT
jgi:hypothetical protein